MTVSYPEGVARFYAVLQEEGSAHDVVDDRVLHQGVVDSVQVGRPVKRAVDAAALHVRLRHVTCANDNGKFEFESLCLKLCKEKCVKIIKCQRVHLWIVLLILFSPKILFLDHIKFCKVALNFCKEKLKYSENFTHFILYSTELKKCLGKEDTTEF